MSSSGAYDKDSTYTRLQESSPEVIDTTLDLSSIIKEVINILRELDKGLDELISARMVSAQNNELNPADIAGGQAYETINPLDNGKMTPLLTQPPYQSPLSVDSRDAPDSSHPISFDDGSNNALLSRKINLPGNCLIASDDII